MYCVELVSPPSSNCLVIWLLSRTFWESSMPCISSMTASASALVEAFSSFSMVSFMDCAASSPACSRLRSIRVSRIPSMAAIVADTSTLPGSVSGAVSVSVMPVPAFSPCASPCAPPSVSTMVSLSICAVSSSRPRRSMTASTSPRVLRPEMLSVSLLMIVSAASVT